MNIKKLRDQASKITELVLEAGQLREELVSLDRKRDSAAFDKEKLVPVEAEIKHAEARLATVARELRKYGIDLL